MRPEFTWGIGGVGGESNVQVGQVGNKQDIISHTLPLRLDQCFWLCKWKLYEFVSLVIKCQPMSPLLEDASNGHAAPLGPLMCTHSDTGSQTYSNFQGHGGFCFGMMFIWSASHTALRPYLRTTRWRKLQTLCYERTCYSAATRTRVVAHLSSKDHQKLFSIWLEIVAVQNSIKQSSPIVIQHSKGFRV